MAKKDDYIKGLFAYSAFPTPALGRKGALGRSTYDQPGFNNLNFTFGKTITNLWFFGESMKIQAKGEVFNLFNQSNLTNVSSDLSSGWCGRATNQPAPRSLQIHIRASF